MRIELNISFWICQHSEFSCENQLIYSWARVSDRIIISTLKRMLENIPSSPYSEIIIKECYKKSMQDAYFYYHKDLGEKIPKIILTLL